MQAINVEGQSFYFLIVSLDRQSLAVKRKFQGTDTACLDYDLVACFDGFFGGGYQDLFQELFAVGGDRHPGVFTGFDQYGECSRDCVGRLALTIGVGDR
jgi:hypothetical protein